MLRVNRQNIDHGAALDVHHAAAEMDAVIRQLAGDQRMVFLEGDVRKAEQRHREFAHRTAKLHRGMARLRIDAARVGNADRKVHIAHDLREQDVRNIVDLHLFAGLAVEEIDPLKRRRFDIRR